MKKVLMITTHFAPDIHVGAKRMTKFAKYLPLYGWQPVVLTKEVTEYHGLDETLLQELSSDLPIYRVREWRLLGAQTNSSLVTQGISSKGKPTPVGLRYRLLRIADFFLFYDYSWLIPAFLSARRLIRKNDIRVIYSSSPNPEAHLVALLLKLTTPVRWVCEYRDPWTRQPVTFYPPASPLQPLVEWALEGKVLSHADRLIFVGPRCRDRVLEGRSPGLAAKAYILFNGYDESDFVGLSNNEAGDSFCFTIGHIGTVGRDVTPMNFLQALGQLIRQKPEMRPRIRVRFIGEVKYDPIMAEQIPQVIHQEGLDDIVTVLPFLSHREALALMVQCHCLLLILQQEHATHVLGAKLFEYLRAQRPILALVPTAGDAARLIVELRAGVVMAAEDTEGIVGAILELYDAFCRGELTVPGDLTQIQRFERRRQTATLAQIFDALTDSA